MLPPNATCWRGWTGRDSRWARRDDAADIARLFLISSDRLAACIWARHTRPAEALEGVGAARCAREGVAFSYENCLLATRGSDVLGMVHAFEMPEGSGEPEADPVLAPYAVLEDPGSLYVSGLAVHAPLRAMGVGGALFDRVEALALTRAIPRLSLVCFERNTGAYDFYLRRGFRIAAGRPLFPHPALHHRDGDALLMVRPGLDRAPRSDPSGPPGDRRTPVPHPRPPLHAAHLTKNAWT